VYFNVSVTKVCHEYLISISLVLRIILGMCSSTVMVSELAKKNSLLKKSQVEEVDSKN